MHCGAQINSNSNVGRGYTGVDHRYTTKYIGDDDNKENEGQNILQRLKFQCLKDDSSYNIELQQGAVYFISSPLIFAQIGTHDNNIDLSP